MRLLLALPIALCGCAQVGAPPAQLPLAFEGKFEFKSEGSASAIGELAKPESKDEKKVSLAFHTGGSYRVDSSDGGYIVALRDVTAAYLDGGKRVEVFSAPQSWVLRLMATGDKLESAEPLRGEKLLISRLFKSYWRTSPGSSKGGDELELDGLNSVSYSADGKRTWVAIQSQTANLASLPNRSSIPITAKVSGDIVYGGQPFPTSIEGSKKTLQFMGDREVGASSLFIKLSQSEASSKKPQKANFSFQYSLVEVAANPFGERELQLKNLGTASVDSVFKDLAQPNLEVKDRNRLFLQLRAIVYLFPEQCESIVSKAKGSEARMLAAEALAGIASPQAQSSLLKVLKASESDEQFESILALLVPITKFEPPLASYIVDMAFSSEDPEKGYTAQLILGSNIRRCLTANRSQARVFSSALAKALTKAKSEDARLNLLYAMGNAGNPELATYQVNYLGSSAARLRAAAVHSLRHLPAEFVNQTLDQFAPKETDAAVLKEVEAIRTLIKEQS